MKGLLATTLILPTALSLPSHFTALSPRQTTSTCATGVHIIVTRGSTEPQGDGETASLSTLIQQQIPGSDDYATVYPALLDPYQQSEGNGTQAILTEVQQYVTSCPDTKIVLLGWSQGGQTELDALCGTSEANFTATAPLDPKYGKNIAAVIAYGDPSRAIGQSYNVGNATDAQMSSYCDIGDPFCASGDILDVHLQYFDKYNTAAAKFVVDKVNDA
ncbi:MAG: hypothetical protein Q9159_002207 [Coniocarpon cinnabarinum]